MKDKPAMRYGPKDCFPTDLEIGPGSCHRSCLRRSCRPHGDSALTILLFSTFREGFGQTMPEPGLARWAAYRSYIRCSRLCTLLLAPSAQFSGLVTTQDNQP